MCGILSPGWFVALLAGLFSATLLAQTASPAKPGPEQKKFEIAVGEWEYTGATEQSPFGPAYKFTGKETCRMILDGFFLESRWRDEGDNGTIAEGVVLQWYDAAAKIYREAGYENDGTASTGVTVITGNTWVTSGKRSDAAGKSYEVRFTSIYSAEGKSRSGKAEYSSDGKKSWRTMWSYMGRKTKP